MNIVAVDIGNTNVAVGLFLDGKEESVDIYNVEVVWSCDP